MWCCLDGKEQRVEAKVNRSANQNGTARDGRREAAKIVPEPFRRWHQA